MALPPPPTSPGPWVVMDGPTVLRPGICTQGGFMVVAPAYHGTLDALIGIDGMTAAERAGNAQVVAAALDLREALRGLLAFGRTAAGPLWASEAIAAAEAALAKAGG